MPAANFCELVGEDFKKSNLKVDCLAESRRAIISGNSHRAFDVLPRMVNSKALTGLIEKFSQIQNQLGKQPAHLQLALINDWIEQVIEHGCTALLDENGRILPAVVQLFEWEDIKNQINVLNLLCSFVNAVIQQLYADQRFIKLGANEYAFNKIIINVHNNHRCLCKQHLKEIDLCLVPEVGEIDGDLSPKLYDVPQDHSKPNSNNTAAAVGIGVGVGVGVIALTAAGILLFGSNASKGSTFDNDFLPKPKI